MQRLRKISNISLCLIGFFVLIGNIVYAQQIPHFIKYHGDIKKWIEPIEEEKGKDKDKDKDKDKKLYTLTFRIYNIETGGVAFWKEIHLAVPVEKGVFEVLLGSFTPLDLKFDKDYWLSVEIKNKGEIIPRERMTSFGYAYMSEDSYKLGGRYSDDFALFGHSHIGEDVVSPVAEAINADTVDGLHAHQIGGVKDHGGLTGLADDDHLQYLNNGRGDERYAGLGWDGLTKLETTQFHIADKNNPHIVTLEQLGHIDHNPDEEAPTLTERGEPTGTEIQGWADDITAWGHSNLVMNLNADMIDGLHATMSDDPQANTLIALGADMKFPSSVIPSITEATNADTVDSIHASAAPTPNYLLPLDSTGKFPASIISGAVGEATNADTVDGIHANTMATANYLYPLNANAKFPASILEGIVADADKLDGRDSSEFSLIGHFHTLQDLSDVTSDLRVAFLAAGTAGANAANRLATMADVGLVSGLWTDAGAYIYPNNAGSGFQIADSGNLIVNGKVGIGVADPEAKLHVEDSQSNVTEVLLNNAIPTGYTQLITRGGARNRSGSFGYYNTAHNPGSGSELLGPDAVVLSSASGVTGGIRIIAANNGAHNAPIIFATGLWYAAAAERMRITSSGSVGIGTVNPQGKLDVNGAIYQRGSLLHADYVFEPAYQLEPIEEHANYMWREKHLKAVPKATKTEEGQEIVEVGARNRGILEELEKAHIYIVQLNERIKKLEEKIK